MKRINPGPFSEAIQWANARGVVLPDVYYGELQGIARATSFSVAGLAELDQLKMVQDSLNQALARGQSYQGWVEAVTQGEIRLDLPPHRLDNIFRTNIQGAYSRGRCEHQARNTERRPWLLYDATNDSRTRPAHAAMDGFVARYDDPVWQTWRPPCGYRCRCTVVALSDAQAERYRSTDERRLRESLDRAQARGLALEGGPDAGWDYSVCEEPMEGVRRAVERRYGSVDRRYQKALQDKVNVPAHEWVRLDPGALNPAIAQETLAQVKMLGAERLAEILSSPARVPGRRLLDGRPLEALLDAYPHERVNMRQDVMAAFRGELDRALRKHRTFGQATVDMENVKGKGKAAVDRAAARYPDEWVIAANERGGPLRAVYTQDRGEYNAVVWNHKRVQVEARIRTDDSSTAVHEYGHRLQNQIPELDALFQAEHLRRTQGDPLVALYSHAPDETGRPDAYVNRYQGRVYSRNNADGQALEVLTMAFQAVLGQDRTADRLLSETLDRDRGMLELALGALFHVTLSGSP